MQVNEQEVTWENGRVVIFDDMNPHEVWNDTDDVRIVLLLHLKRPLRFPGSAVRDFLVAALRSSPFVRDGVRNLEQWEKSTGSAKRAHLQLLSEAPAKDVKSAPTISSVTAMTVWAGKIFSKKLDEPLRPYQSSNPLPPLFGSPHRRHCGRLTTQHHLWRCQPG
jgi:hypothetical protein